MTKAFSKKKDQQNMTAEKAFQYAVSLYQHNKKKEARALFEQILAQVENTTAVLQVLAIMDDEDGAWERALQRLEQALHIEPNNHSLWFDKASILAKQGFNKEAQNITRKLLAIAPNNLELLKLEQQISTSLNHKKSTLALKKTMDATVSQEIEQTLTLAKKMSAKGDKAQAKMLYQAILSIANDQQEALLGIAKIQIDEQAFALAKQTLLRAYDPKAPLKEVLVLLVHCEMKIEQFKQAKSYCQQGIQLWWDDPIFYRMLISNYEKSDNWQEAYKYGREFLQLFPQDQDLLHRFARASFLQLRARHNFTLEAIINCENHILKAMQNADKENWWLLSTFLAQVYWYKGEAKKAKLLLEDYIAHHPEDLSVRFSINFIYKSLGLWSEHYRDFELGLQSGHRLSYKGDLPRWDLSRPKKDIVLVLPEQGVGDELLYFHNVRLIIEQAQKVYIACDFRLESIAHSAFPSAFIIPIKRNNYQEMDIPSEILNEITSWVAGGSLAGICYERHNRHIYQTPYINISKKADTQAQKRLTKLKSENPNTTFIGICWRSGLAESTRNIHYLSTEELAHLVRQFTKVTFINLQYDDCSKELKKIEKITKIKIHQIKNIDLKNDFEATAALIHNLDMVITAGTSVHRLTTAIGTKCYVFSAGTNESDYTQPQISSNKSETIYFYPPMLENKYEMLKFIAKNITKSIGFL